MAEQIRAEIAQHGAISFARFMDLALYCPHCGYYEQKEDTPGKWGDFYTSVSVGPIFGELLAFQFAEWLEELPIADCRLPIVEAGAHDGRLAKDILNWLKLRRPALFERIEYWIVEPSARRQEWQRETLNEFAPRVRWHASRLTPHASRLNGIIFSNELLDALPVHRLGWDAQRREWFEWGVTIQGERFVWTRVSKDAAWPAELAGLLHDACLKPPARLLEILPDGFTVDVSPAAAAWWRDAAEWLQRGKLVAIDYGLAAAEFFAPQRKDGTLRAYRQHRVSGDVLAHPGQQDLTAHVNFTALQTAGERAGLATESFTTQAQFLVRIMQQAWREPPAFGGWNAGRLRQFKTLTHPEHLGRPFRVLVQGV